jgi:hypothetical protein
MRAGSRLHLWHCRSVISDWRSARGIVMARNALRFKIQSSKVATSAVLVRADQAETCDGRQLLRDTFELLLDRANPRVEFADAPGHFGNAQLRCNGSDHRPAAHDYRPAHAGAMVVTVPREPRYFRAPSSTYNTPPWSGARDGASSALWIPMTPFPAPN